MFFPGQPLRLSGALAFAKRKASSTVVVVGKTSRTDDLVAPALPNAVGRIG